MSQNFNWQPPSSFLPSDKLRDLADQIKESLAYLSREGADLGYLREEIAKLGEVAEESHMQVQRCISTLQKVANQLETSSGLKPQSYQHQFVQAQPVAAPAPQQAGLIAEVGVAQFEPALWRLDQE